MPHPKINNMASCDSFPSVGVSKNNDPRTDFENASAAGANPSRTRRQGFH